MTAPSTPGAQKVADLLSQFAAGGTVAPTTTPEPAPAKAPAKPKGAALSFPRPNGELYFPRIVDADGTHDVGLLRKARGTTLAENLYVLFHGEPGCIYGDADMIVNRGGNSMHMSLRELVHRFNGGQPRANGQFNGKAWDPSIPTMVQHEASDGTIRLIQISAAWFSGVKQTFTVTTDTGRTIRATDEHPFLTERGWSRLDKLQVGDLVHVLGQQSAGGRQIKQRYRDRAGLTHHPYATKPDAKHGRNKVAEHRLVVEADLNGVTLPDWLTALRTGELPESPVFLTLGQAVHHIDGNPINNDLGNLAVMTTAEHHRLHAEQGKTRNVLFKHAVERIVSVEAFGQEDTFDIEVVDDPHNFLANGFVVHNTGKSAACEAAFPDLLTLSGDGDTTTDDFVGSWVQNPDGTYEWTDGPLVTAMENGTPLLVDEVALIDTKVMSLVYSAMDGRGEVRIKANPARGIVKAQPGFYVIGACNPHAPGARMSEALLSRFSIHVESTTDYDLAKTIGVPAKAVTVAKNLDTKRNNGEVSWAPQMRELLAFKRTSERFSTGLAVANLIGVAPEDDRAIVADVVSRAFGAAVANLRQGAAASE